MSFKKYLEALKFKPKTIGRYLAWERSFLRYLEGQLAAELESKELLLYIQSKEVKRSTLVLLLGRLRRYYAYLGIAFPLENLQLKGYDQSEKTPFLSKDQLEQIGEAYQQNKRLSLISQVAIQLLIYQGVSTHELRLLKGHHLDLSKGVITIPADQLASRELLLLLLINPNDERSTISIHA